MTLSLLVTFLILATQAVSPARAADPSSATLTPASTQVVWRGTALGGGGLNDAGLGFVGGEDLCEEGVTCDTFTLTLDGAPSDWESAGKIAHVHLEWTIPAQDFDLYIHKGDLSGPLVASSGNGATSGVLTTEDADLDPMKASVGTGVFAVRVVYYAATMAEQYTATASVVDAPLPPPPPPPPPTNEPEGTPRFYNYIAPPGVADFAGEPSIGVNGRTEKLFSGIPNGGTVTFFGGFLPYMLRATFNDAVWPAKVTWEKAPLTMATLPRVFGDPILFTDRETGRVFVSQEMGLTPLGSTMEWSDDDGRTFTPSEGSGAPSGIDHQTVGGGPYHEPIPTGVNPLYPHGVWYCSQSIVDAVCSLSLDGGITFGPAIPMYSLVDCDGLHGHIKIGPEGTAYVPNRNCGGKQAVVVSENNGLTWSIRRIPQSTAGDRDPSVAVGTDGTLYLGYQAADGTSHVAVSRDKGLSWESDTDVGAPLGIRNSLFHAAVAGDGDRAAVAYFGTTTAGSDYNTPGFGGDWHLYVSTTYNRGLTWWTQNVTPGDPIQRGGICDGGACRNLLDFFGAEIDNQGRVLVAYDDGCISHACITGERSYGLPGGNDFTAKAVIARQTGGKTMFSSFDPPPGPVEQPPQSPPLPPPGGATCGSLVATDSTGDSGNPVLSAAGSAPQLDIKTLSFAPSPDGQALVTTITLADFTTTPAPGSLGAYYRVVWTSARRNPDGTLTTTVYAAEAATDVSGGVSYRYGVYDPAGNSFVGSTVAATGSFTTGPDGALSVQVPLSFLGNPVIPVTDEASLPAVIEPYAVVFVHEEVVYFATPVERAPDYGFAGSSWAVCLPSVTECLEDDDERIAYSDGWHTVSDQDASDGHFRFHAGRSPEHSAALSFEVPAGRVGEITYSYATSTKGGSAGVRLDGSSVTVSYAGSTGGLKDPVQGATVAFANLAAGSHTMEIENMEGAVYVDKLCLESSSPEGQPASGPGPTVTQSLSLAPLQEVVSSLPIGTGATAISVVAASSGSLPFKLVLVGPSGLALRIADSVNGIAAVTAPVSASGTYLVKVLNVSLGPAQVWTAATPTIAR